jgi:hypothetical protein
MARNPDNRTAGADEQQVYGAGHAPSSAGPAKTRLNRHERFSDIPAGVKIRAKHC